MFPEQQIWEEFGYPEAPNKWLEMVWIRKLAEKLIYIRISYYEINIEMLKVSYQYS